MQRRKRIAAFLIALSPSPLLAAAPEAAPASSGEPPTCRRQLSANVVALEQPYFLNRLGTTMPHGMLFSLERDVVPSRPEEDLGPGNAELRPGKRPRPLVLRMNVGDCLEIRLRNLLSPERPSEQHHATRSASIHVYGMQLVTSMADDGSFVGSNPSSLAAPGEEKIYHLYAEHEGTFLLSSTAATFGGDGAGGHVLAGLFGAVNVEPAGAEWYRSQTTREDLEAVRRTTDGQTVFDYQARYPTGHPRAGTPILAMLDSNGEIVHSDLTAIITGPDAGHFLEAHSSAVGAKTGADALPKDRRPFREVTLIYHETWGARQGLWWLGSTGLRTALDPGNDIMGINYGSAGLSGRIMANRIGLGPAWDCVECKYEEFYLSAWASGEPAMIVDVPANALDAGGYIITGPKATKALYPDDPSNVYHSYLNDPIRFRVLHGGTRMQHVHHQHAHPWLHSPNNPRSGYIDSQAMTHGAAFTLNMAHKGSGSRAQTVGDAIFHCHIYLHFGMGMWGLWRVHDVFEEGTELDAEGRPVPGARALPDGEITRGVPIPALVPLPTLPMAPAPAAVRLSDDGRRVEVMGEGNPGFPFFVPGVAGRRPPRPPLDSVHDGGLPRHVAAVAPEDLALHAETRFDFSKTLERFAATELPEEGTAVERAAMAAHARRQHPSSTPGGKPATFLTNGLAPVAGAPFADPCAIEPGQPLADAARHYRASALQLDVVFNKKGWHYPQQRILTLWGDAQATLEGERTPEPLFFRANSGECIELWHTNLVPGVREMDDFLVRTPTDILGQHIHLAQFDVLASDGAATGWNYEDGTLSPDDVRERIEAINADGGLHAVGGTRRMLEAQPHPYFGQGHDGAWLGAQTTVQRWYADPVLDHLGEDRTLRSVFTHDHFGPTTHQQTGLFASLLIEPAGSQWRDPESGEMLAGRWDGGPTSWRADILTPNASDSFREFALTFQDQQLAYRAGGSGHRDVRRALRAPLLEKTGAITCFNGLPAPCPQVASDNSTGVGTINYRSEPLPFRLAGADPATEAGDLAHVFRSIPRADPELNIQPDLYPPLTAGVLGTDPFTPLLRAYENDRVKIRAISANDVTVGALGLDGLRWRFEPADPNSGYRAAQEMSTSEVFTLDFELPKAAGGEQTFADYPYFMKTSTNALAHGMWGLLRAYKGPRDDLLPLPQNPQAQAPAEAFAGCPAGAPVRRYGVTAVAASAALPEGRLIYSSRDGREIADPQGLLYVRSGDLDSSGRLRSGVPVEPLILRAAAGECIEVQLTNALPPGDDLFRAENFVQDMQTWVERIFRQIPIFTSRQVGLKPQLLTHDITSDHGANVGANPVQTLSPGESRTLRWYAGLVEAAEDGRWQGAPVEFGSTLLLPADPSEQHTQGLFGALIVEPEGATWVEDVDSRASATVTQPDGSNFREFVLLPQQEVEANNSEGPLEKYGRGLNYRLEMDYERLGYEFLETNPRDLDLTCLLSNQLVGDDPQTPVFSAPVGTPVRFRLLNPGNILSEVLSFQLYGHIWQELPYVDGSRRLGRNPLSEWKGSVWGLGARRRTDLLVDKAGGAFGVTGDYFYRFYPTVNGEHSLWGLFRVGAGAAEDGDFPDTVTVTRARPTDSGELEIAGRNTVDPDTGTFASEVALYVGGAAGCDTAQAGEDSGALGIAEVDPRTGRWSLLAKGLDAMPDALCARSTQGGLASLTLPVATDCLPAAADPTP
ncbi:MAG: copper oxidase [Acidobacteriota bacterium]